MATQFNFNGRLIKLPGAYTETKSGVNNPPLQTSYGNVLIVDNNASGEYGIGSGVNGSLTQGESSIYTFDNLRDMRGFVGGGLLWDLALPLFRPFGGSSRGASNVMVIRAMTTTGSSHTFDLENGVLKMNCKYEGLVGNGVEGVTGQLTQGFAATMEAGVIDSAKYKFKFWRGTYKGVDSNGALLELSLQDAKPVLIATSPEVATIEELIAWCEKDYNFGNYFEVDASSTTGALTSTDLGTLSGNLLFSGGTQVANPSDFNDVLDVVKKLDYTFILALDRGSDATSADNFKMLYHVESEAKYQKYMVVGGGNDKSSFESESIAAAASYDSSRVIVVHGACKIHNRGGSNGMLTKDSLYQAALVLGRTCGLEPQIPITFKGLDVAGQVHMMTDKERERALEAGVLTVYFDSEIAGGIFAITQGINSMQNNRFVVNEDGTSHLVSVERIAAALNKSIEINAKNKLLGNQNEGPNRSTLSPAIVKEWVENHLRTKEATPTVDNLIIQWQDVTVSVEQDAYKIRFAFEPNFEVNKLFFTGLIIDPNLV